MNRALLLGVIRGMDSYLDLPTSGHAEIAAEGAILDPRIVESINGPRAYVHLKHGYFDLGSGRPYRSPIGAIEG